MDGALRTLLGRGAAKGMLARRLAWSFAMVALVAALICSLLLVLLLRVAGSVRQMQRDESAIRRGLDLATAVREQYIHAAHTIIAGNDSHVGHYADWVRKVSDETSALRSQVPAAEQSRLARVGVMSTEMDRLFLERILPAIRAGDSHAVGARHDELEELVVVAAADADRVARSVEARMSGEHMDATHVTYAAAAIALLGIVGLGGLAIASTRRLERAVLGPLDALAQAAARIGTGDFTARVEVRVDGELGAVAHAFEQMGEQLSEHQRRLLTSERMAALGQLAAGVAHEINNPIGVIRGYLRTMIPEAERQELRAELEILDEEAAACQRIADDLVAYARAPELSLNKVPVDIGTTLEQTGERFEASGESNGCRIQVDADHSQLMVDALRMRQVLQNLLRNAVQASGAGSLIEVQGKSLPRTYTIRVLDRGSGISSELLPHIFEPFLSGRFNGTGLGLAVSSGILRAHGGLIEARPRTGGGTELLVTLPRDAAGGTAHD